MFLWCGFESLGLSTLMLNTQPLVMDHPTKSSLSSFLKVLFQRNPHSIALICGDRHLSYRELDQQSNQLANYFDHINLAPNALIGVYLERSIESVVAILAILKAGRTYVPLDPHYPGDRINFIAQETQFSALLTTQALQKPLPPLPTTQTICLDAAAPAIAAQPPVLQKREHDSTPDNLAYVMYTSGSTGKPKGVKMPRANVQRYITALAEVVPVNASDIYLHVASFSFSSSVRQLLLPLYVGATLVLATREQTKNPLHLLQLMRQHRVTVSDGVPSVWRYALQLIHDSAEERLRASDLSLRYIILSGDLTPIVLLKRLRQFFGDRVRFFNVYGQTETIGNTAYALPPNFEQESGYMPVGYPYPHNQAYVLDESLTPVPDGAVGELYIAGGSLAEGYMNRDDLTAEKFIEHPWNEGPTRIFNTGDLARRHPDGCIELLGRTDFQVKIRGMRVELDEIAIILEQHPEVKAAAAAAHDSPTGEKFIVGYVVPASAHASGKQWQNDLRKFLGEHLPDYMVPALFMELGELPKTPSGKLNRRELPKPNSLSTQPATQATHSPIQAIFSKAFHIPSVSPDDTFIDLGGHSLLYVQFSIELERHLGYVPVNWETMTVAELEQQRKRDDAHPLIEINIVLRAMAICGIVANHAGLLPLRMIQGGAVLLLFIAGLNFARFQSNNLFQGRQKQILTSLLTSLIIPYLVLESIFQLYSNDFNPSSLLFFSNFVGPEVMTMFLQVWFIQLFVQCVVIMLLLFSIQPLRQLAQENTWEFSLGLVGLTNVIAFVGPNIWDTTDLYHRVPHMMMWLFLLGWTANFTKTRLQRIALTILFVFSVLTVRDLITSEITWLLIGGVLTIWLKYVVIPRPFVLPIQMVGAASYYIYLTHVGFFSLANKIGLSHPAIHWGFGILGGVAFWFGMQALQKWGKQKPTMQLELG